MVSTFEFANHVVGIMISADVDEKMLKEIHRVIEEKFVVHRRINLFVEVKTGVEVPLRILFKDLVFKLENSKRFNKIAVVTDPGFFKNVLNLKDILMDAEVESFSHQERIKAMNWISE